MPLSTFGRRELSRVCSIPNPSALICDRDTKFARAGQAIRAGRRLELEQEEALVEVWSSQALPIDADLHKEHYHRFP